MTTIDFFKLFATQGGNSLTALTRPSYCLFRGRFVFLVVYLHFRVEMTRPLWGYSAYLPLSWRVYYFYFEKCAYE